MKDSLKCLVVEDEAISALSLEMELENAGFEVAGIVATGEKALETISHEKPDFVLMDLRLAGSMDGFETTQQISETHHIPVIIITGYPDQKLMDMAKQLHKVRYLIKPLRTEILLKEIDSLIE